MIVRFLKNFGLSCGVFLLVACNANVEATGQTSQSKSTIYIASDSTASNHKARAWPMAGWAVFLQCGLGPNTPVENRAIGGRSTKKFINEGRLDKIAEDISAGDTLLIQFAHNDANINKPERYVTVEEFSEYLIDYIEVARRAEAPPVLLTAIARRNFKEGVLVEDFQDYIDATRRVAQQENVALIDARELTAEWLRGLGEQKSKRMFLHYSEKAELYAYPEGIEDNTHLSELGARRVAAMISQELKGFDLPFSSQIRTDVKAFQMDVHLGALACQ